MRNSNNIISDVQAPDSDEYTYTECGWEKHFCVHVEKLNEIFVKLGFGPRFQDSVQMGLYGS